MTLPQLYTRWLERILPGPVPVERLATCEQCAMRPAAGARDDAEDGRVFFDAELKCCTYVPELPSFRLGRMLDGGLGQDGLATVRQRLDARVDLTPLGLASPRRWQLLYDHGRAGFGHAQALRCPHLLEGRCGVWPYRAAVCATWFCKHLRGGVGRLFWAHVRDLLRAIERALGHWCLLEHDFDAAALERLMAPSPSHLSAAALDDRLDPAHHEATWGRWSGQEEAFLLSCAERVEALRWEEIRAIGGPEVALRERILLRAYRRLRSERVPASARTGTYRVLGTCDGRPLIMASEWSQPLRVPPALLAALTHFDGRPIEQALASIEATLGLKLARSLVRKLVDHGVLVEPSRS